MNASVIFVVFLVYTILLFVVSYFTSKKSDTIPLFSEETETCRGFSWPMA